MAAARVSPRAAAFVPTPTSTPTIVPTATAAPSATATATLPPTATSTPTPGPYGVTWRINCEDDDRTNGYLFGGFCVPGLITWETSRQANPAHFVGLVTFYAEGIMERVVRRRGLSMRGHKGAVALPFCGDIGSRVWLQRPEHEWEGPFVVADCSGRNGLFYHVTQMGLVAEVDYGTAARWGARAWPWVHVCKSEPPCGPAWNIENYLLERLEWASEDAPEVWTP